jgi:hypothetical protein
MDEEEREWTKNKRNLILTMMRQKFEEQVYEYLEKGEYQSLEEMDAWIDERLHQFEDERRAIREYYNSKMYS